MTSHHVIERLYKAWWAVTALLLIVGVVVRFELVTDEDLGPLAPGAEVAAPDGATLAVAGGAFDGLPSVRYAGLDIALVNARPVPVNNAGVPIVVVELALRNTTSVQARVPTTLLNLVGPHGALTRTDRFEYSEHDSRVVINAGRTEEVLAVFKLDTSLGTDLEGYQLQVGERGRWPETMALVGEIEASAYPRALENTGPEPGPVTVDGLDFELIDAHSDLEYGVYRAAIDQHLAVMTVSATAGIGTPARPLPPSARWTLTDNHGDHQPIRATVGTPSEDGTAVDIELVFAYSTEASQLTLRVGQSGHRPVVARFDVQPFE